MKTNVYLQSLILGGNDTTLFTLTWAISLLLNNPQKLKKAQEELDIQVGSEAVRHKETGHYQGNSTVVSCFATFSASRNHGGLYHVPAGTCLFVNLWKLQCDPSIWSSPLEFQPERFLIKHAHLDVRGQNFVYIPFGSGRRCLHLTLARLLHRFNLERISDNLVDMSECPGMTIPKATPLEVILTPRLPSVLYC